MPVTKFSAGAILSLFAEESGSEKGSSRPLKTIKSTFELKATNGFER
jgi:hypothetical protein